VCADRQYEQPLASATPSAIRSPSAARIEPLRSAPLKPSQASRTAEPAMVVVMFGVAPSNALTASSSSFSRPLALA
jgi:hypothetical protein